MPGNFLSKRLARGMDKAHHLSSALKLWYYRTVWGMDLGEGLRISRSAKLDRTNPRGVHIGDYTLISFDVAIIAHDFIWSRPINTYIGANCFVGARSVIMPGVRIGDHCIIGSGSVVTTDIPSNSIAVGNPAKVIKSGIVTGKWGVRNPRALAKQGIVVPEDEDRSPAATGA